MGKRESECFIEGTKILMYDGSKKNIEDIVEDNLILSFDEKTKSFVPGIVTKHIHQSQKQHSLGVEVIYAL